MAKFDPYHKWLGIPPREQPAHYYRLLGITLFEEDPEVIEAAADRCMAFVQQCALGEHQKASQQILNELSAARVCLLVAEEKQKYDTELRAQLKFTVPESVSSEEWDEEPGEDLLPDRSKNKQRRKRSTRPARVKSPPRVPRKRKHISKRKPTNFSIRNSRIAGGVFLVILVIMIGFQFMGGDDDELDSQDQTAAIMEPLAEPVAKPEVEPTQTQSPQKNTEPLAQVGEKPKKSMPPSTNKKKVKAKEVDWLPVEDLVASYDRVIVHTRSVRDPLLVRKETNSAESDKAKPDKPENDPFKRRTAAMAGGKSGSGGSSTEGLTFGVIPDASEMMMGMKGGSSMAGPPREGRGLRFVAVRGVFDLETQQDKLQRALGDAYSLQDMQNGKLLDFLDFELERRTKSMYGNDPWSGSWEKVDIQTSIDVLKESADFDPEVVNSGITDRVFTMPLPSRIAGFWDTVATHPRVEYLTLNEEEIEQELEFNRRIMDQYKKTHSSEKVFKEKQKGFSTLQLDMRGMRSELMNGGEGGNEMESVMQGMANFMMQERQGRSGEPMDEKKLIQKLKASVAAAGRLLLFRYFDFDLKPGDTFRYRVRLVIRNPNYQRPIEEVVLPSVAEGEFRNTPWSNETAAVHVEQDAHYYLSSVRPPRGVSGTTATFEVFQWYPETGTTIHNSVIKTEVGEVIGGERVAELYDVAKEKYSKNAKVNFDTQNYLVDAVAAPALRPEDHPDLKIPARKRGQPAMILPEAIVVDNFGVLKVAMHPEATPYSTRSYYLSKSRLSQERDSLKWVKEATETRTAAPTESRGKISKRKKNPISLLAP